MASRVRENLTDLRALRYRAQQRAVWEFAAKVDDWRCGVCFARIGYDDRVIFDHTHLCPACSEAVNETLVWRIATNDPDFA